MAYTELGVVNFGLQRLGEKLLTSAEWIARTKPSAAAAYAAWEYVRDEVLEAGNWNFAKTRTTLSKVAPRIDLNCGNGKHLYFAADKYLADTLDISIEVYSNSADALSVVVDPDDSQNILVKLANATPGNNDASDIQTALQALGTVNGVSVAAWTVTANAEYTATPCTADIDLDAVNMASVLTGQYYFAYLLPDNFLKVAKQRDFDAAIKGIGGYNTNFNEYQLLKLRGNVYSYVVETLSDDSKVLLINYDDGNYPLELVYIKRLTDVAKYSAHFISALAYRLAAELAPIIPKDDKKFVAMMKEYDGALKRAEGLNQSSDYVRNETGSSDWVDAGW